MSAPNGSLTPYAELAEVIASLPVLLREARRSRGLSQRAAAKELGCSFSTVSRMEAGEDCALSNATAVLRWLDQRPTAPAVCSDEWQPPHEAGSHPGDCATCSEAVHQARRASNAYPPERLCADHSGAPAGGPKTKCPRCQDGDHA